MSEREPESHYEIDEAARRRATRTGIAIGVGVLIVMTITALSRLFGW